MPIVAWLVRVLQSPTSTIPESGGIDDEAGLFLKKQIELTFDENRVMELFIQADGRSIFVDDIKL